MRAVVKGPQARFVFAIALLLAAACAVNPVTGRRELALLSEAQEVALGRDSDPQIVAEFGLYDDPELQAYVDAVGQKMAKLSHRPDLPFTFRVLDSPVINAFALPGGFIYVTRGILAHMNNEAELAVVLGHEIGHVTARHGVQQYSRAQLATVGLGVGAILSEDFARFGGLAQSAAGLLFMKFGRDDERQSDELGVEYALRAGYDAEIGVHFFEVLDRQTQESGQSIPNWMSTHPAPEARVAKTRELARAGKVQHPQSTRSGEIEHKKQVDEIVFGDDPRQGFQDGDVFKHPALQFQLQFPASWKVQNTPSAVLAIEPQERAALKLTLEASEGANPAAFAQRIVQQTNARVVSGGAESIHGANAYVAILDLPAENGQTSRLLAAFVQRQTAGPMYQMVGFAAPGTFASHQSSLAGAVRSLQTLRDPQALAIQPNRIDVQTLQQGTTLAQAVTKSAGPAGVGTVALLNNLQPQSNLAKGFQLKLVRGSYRGH